MNAARFRRIRAVESSEPTTTQIATTRYVELARALDDRPVYGLQARGLAPDQAPDDRIEAMAERYVDALCSVAHDGPVHLVGWSLGGFVAVEVARLLTARGYDVGLLALLDTALPTSNGDATPAERAALLHDVARHLGVPLDALTTSAASSETADVEVAVERLLAQMHSGGTAPTDVGADALRRRLVTFSRHLEAVRLHRPGPVASRLHVFDAETPIAGVTRRVPPWERLAAGGVVRETVPGSHHELLRAPHVETLAARLRIALAGTERARA